MSPSPAGAVGGRAPWRATVLTVFPGMFPGPLGHSLAGQAFEAGVWSLEAVDIRAHAGYELASVDELAFDGKGNRVHLIDAIERKRVEETGTRCQIPDFRSGGTLRVSVRAIEGSCECIQACEGVCHASPLLSRMHSVQVSKKWSICSYGLRAQRHDGASVVAKPDNLIKESGNQS